MGYEAAFTGKLEVHPAIDEATATTLRVAGFAKLAQDGRSIAIEDDAKPGTFEGRLSNLLDDIAHAERHAHGVIEARDENGDTWTYVVRHGDYERRSELR